MLFLAVTMLAAQADAGVFVVDAKETELVVLTAPDGVLSGVSHPHVVLARKVEGTIEYDEASPDSTRVTLQVAVDGLENDDVALRKRFGMTSVLSADDRKAVAVNLRSDSQLDLARWPTISFRSQSVHRIDAEHLQVSGTLSMRGVSVGVVLPMTVKVAGGVFRAEGSLTVTHAMFGFKPFSAALGTIRNAEALTLKVLVVARAR